jgi:hypothetical protein
MKVVKSNVTTCVCVVPVSDMIHAFRIKCCCYIGTNFKKNWVGNRDHTVPMETPQSMLEEPSNGSKTTQYLNHKKKKVHIN